jgi:hypothetical protein
MSTAEDRWFEAWFTESSGIEPSYLLIMRLDESRPGLVVVLGPQLGYQIVHQGHSYEEARLWLLEDEYSLVTGREFPDDGLG